MARDCGSSRFSIAFIYEVSVSLWILFVNNLMNKKQKGGNEMKKLINVLWAIEKDLRIIASNTEVLKSNKEFIGFDSVTIKPKFK